MKRAVSARICCSKFIAEDADVNHLIRRRRAERSSGQRWGCIWGPVAQTFGARTLRVRSGFDPHERPEIQAGLGAGQCCGRGPPALRTFGQQTLGTAPEGVASLPSPRPSPALPYAIAADGGAGEGVALGVLAGMESPGSRRYRWAFARIDANSDGRTATSGPGVSWPFRSSAGRGPG